MTPDSIIVNLCGPYPGRKHDAGINIKYTSIFIFITLVIRYLTFLRLHISEYIINLNHVQNVDMNLFTFVFLINYFHFKGILADTNLYTKLRQIAVHGDNQYIIYGDPAYPMSELILKPFCSRVLTAEQIIFSKAISSVRQAVEW